MDPHSNADGYLNAPLAKRKSWQSPEREAAVLAARDEKDSAKRAQMYMDLQKMALEESPFIIMFQQVETIALRKNVDGFIVGSELRSRPLQGRREEVRAASLPRRSRSIQRGRRGRAFSGR